MEVQRDIKEKEEYWKDRANTHLVVATLIITVSFAAGFTIPGGYSNGGMAILSKKAAFKAFVITDTIAMLSSTAAVFLHYGATFSRKETDIFKLYEFAASMVVYALLAMVIAFTSGLYVVLPSTDLAVAVCVISALFSVWSLQFLYVAPR